MARSRKGSLVQDIASKNVAAHEPPVYTDDLLQLLRDTDPDGVFQLTISSAAEPSDKYAQYEDYLSQLEHKSKHYEKLREKTSKITGDLTSIIAKFDGISHATSEFHESTHSIAQRLEESEAACAQIQSELQYFNSLDPITRRLNHYSSPNIVLKESFSQNFVKIDEALAFLQDHSDYLEADAYRIRFKQCLVRACSLVANYLSNRIKMINSEISGKLQENEGQLANSSEDALLYNKFGSVGSIYKQLIVLILDRRQYDEVESVLNDCFKVYFQHRSRLLRERIWHQLTMTSGQDNQTEKFIQDNLLFFENLSQREFSLFSQFYPIVQETEDRFNSWCEQLFEPLYDTVRSRILREGSIPSICDSITLLNKYYQVEESSAEYRLQFKHIKLDVLFKPLLKECQSRLIFRVQIYVETNINGYKPKVDSFVIGHRKAPKENKSKPNDLDDIASPFFLLNEFNSAYPPLVYGIALLSKIYQMVNSAVFDDLAHTIVHDCILSLKKAFELVSKTTTINMLDTHLSLLKNLLLLRDQVQNFDIQYISKETYLDFSGLLKGLKDFSKRSMSMFRMGFETVPRIINNMVDARTELIAELRCSINGLTKVAADQIVQDYLSIADTTDENILDRNLSLRGSIESNLVTIFEQIGNFIGNNEIQTHLIDAIQQEVVSRYANYYETLSDSSAVSAQKLSEIMYIDVFQNFLNNESSKLQVSDV